MGSKVTFISKLEPVHPKRQMELIKSGEGFSNQPQSILCFYKAKPT